MFRDCFPPKLRLIFHHEPLLIRMDPSVLVPFCGTASIRKAQTRDEKVRQDKASVQANGQWIYNDLDLAMAEARRDNKPLLATFRCIP